MAAYDGRENMRNTWEARLERWLESANAGADAALERSGVTTREMRERREAAVRSRLPKGAPRLHLPAPERRPPVAQAPPPPEALRPARPRPTPAVATPQRAPASSAAPSLALRPLLVSRAVTPPPPRPARRDRGPFGVTLSFAVAVEPTPLGPELRVRPTAVAVLGSRELLLAPWRLLCAVAARVRGGGAPAEKGGAQKGKDASAGAASPAKGSRASWRPVAPASPAPNWPRSRTLASAAARPPSPSPRPPWSASSSTSTSAPTPSESDATPSATPDADVAPLPGGRAYPPPRYPPSSSATSASGSDWRGGRGGASWSTPGGESDAMGATPYTAAPTTGGSLLEGASSAADDTPASASTSAYYYYPPPSEDGSDDDGDAAVDVAAHAADVALRASMREVAAARAAAMQDAANDPPRAQPAPQPARAPLPARPSAVRPALRTPMAAAPDPVASSPEGYSTPEGRFRGVPPRAAVVPAAPAVLPVSPRSAARQFYRGGAPFSPTPTPTPVGTPAPFAVPSVPLTPEVVAAMGDGENLDAFLKIVEQGLDVDKALDLAWTTLGATPGPAAPSPGATSSPSDGDPAAAVAAARERLAGRLAARVPLEPTPTPEERTDASSEEDGSRSPPRERGGGGRIPNTPMFTPPAPGPPPPLRPLSTGRGM